MRPGPQDGSRGYGGAWQRLSPCWLGSASRGARSAVRPATSPADHRVPRTKGRANLTLADVVVLCRRCNARKGRSVFLTPPLTPATLFDER
jgi:hypothetical protein